MIHHIFLMFDVYKGLAGLLDKGDYLAFLKQIGVWGSWKDYDDDGRFDAKWPEECHCNPTPRTASTWQPARTFTRSTARRAWTLTSPRLSLVRSIPVLHQVTRRMPIIMI